MRGYRNVAVDLHPKSDDIFIVPHDTDKYITIHPIGTDLTGLDEDRNFCWSKTADGFSFDFIGSTAAHDSFEAVFTLNSVVLDTESDYTAFKNSITKFIRGVVSNKIPSETNLGDENAQNS